MSSQDGGVSDFSFVLRNEFANIRISTEHGRCGVRLKITDLETQAGTYVDLLELASLCEWPEEERLIVVHGHMYGNHMYGNAVESEVS